MEKIYAVQGEDLRLPCLVEETVSYRWFRIDCLFKGWLPFFLLIISRLLLRQEKLFFIPEDSLFQVLRQSDELEILLLFYQIEPIRDIIGNSVVSMHLYSQLTPDLCCVWATGEEEDLAKYMLLLDHTLKQEDDSFTLYERKLLLLGLTYRICSIYNHKLVGGREVMGHKNEIFIRLIQLVEKHYMQERGVEFYADKLCLSPKYLSAIAKNVCGYTVQELIFKAIIRKSIAMLKNTQKNVQEISDEVGFPNASSFGTFFKKQMGVSPQQYRNSLR